MKSRHFVSRNIKTVIILRVGIQAAGNRWSWSLRLKEEASSSTSVSRDHSTLLNYGALDSGMELRGRLETLLTIFTRVLSLGENDDRKLKMKEKWKKRKGKTNLFSRMQA